MKKNCLLFFLAFLPLIAHADAVEIGGIYYNLNGEAETAEVTSNPNKYSGVVVIPETVTKDGTVYQVTSIGEGAFQGCDGLTELYCYCEEIPATDDHAFDDSNMGEATLYVPLVSIDAYKVATPWKDFNEIEPINPLPFNEELGCYIIRSAYDMVSFSNFVNKSKKGTVTGLYKVETEVLDFNELETDTEFEPIGFYPDHDFCGTFDGQGVVIKNVDIYGSNAVGNAIGLFAYTVGATIENIVMDESCVVNANNSVGSIVGYCEGSNIINCVNKATINANSFVGGIAGSVNTLKVEGVIARVSVISNCRNEGTINMVKANDAEIGGIAGAIKDECEVVDCENHGAFTSSLSDGYWGQYLGGIVGYSNGRLIKNCVNTSPVSSTGQNVGGIAGYSRGEVSGCRNSGEVSSSSYYVGGIVGGIQYATLSNCVNTGNVSSSVNGAGGITGSVYRSTVSNCSTKGILVHGTYNVGALFGSYDYNHSPVWDNYYYNDVVVTIGEDSYSGETPRGVGNTKVSDVRDIHEITVNDVIYYNGAAMMHPDEKVTITTGASGISSYYGNKNLDFSGTDDVKAYVVTGYDYDNQTIWLTRVKDVPAGTPILVKGTANQSYDVPVKATSDSYYKNMLVGNLSGSPINAGSTTAGMTDYYLKNGMFLTADGTNPIGNGKAYLQIPTEAPSTTVGDGRSVKLNAQGFASFCATQDMDFTDVEGLKAYAATGYDDANGTIWLSRVNRVSADTPLLLSGAADGGYTIPSVAVRGYYVNMLKGNTSGSDITIYTTADGMTNFYLKGNQLLKATAEGNKIGNGKAFMQIPSAHVTRSAEEDISDLLVYNLTDEPEMISMPVMTRGLDGNGDATGIREVQNGEVKSEKYYNLQGQRVNNPSKGLYIHNGKKVVIK